MAYIKCMLNNKTIQIPWKYDIENDRIQLLSLTKKEVDDHAFLDDRISLLDNNYNGMPVGSFIEWSNRINIKEPVRLVMHIGYTGSTALLRALSAVNRLHVIREPLSLVHIAEEGDNQLFRAALKACAQTFYDNQVPILKPSSRTLVYDDYISLHQIIDSTLMLTVSPQHFVKSICRSPARLRMLAGNHHKALMALNINKQNAISKKLLNFAEENVKLALELWAFRIIMLNSISKILKGKIYDGLTLLKHKRSAIDIFNETLRLQLSANEIDDAVKSQWWEKYAKPQVEDDQNYSLQCDIDTYITKNIYETAAFIDNYFQQKTPKYIANYFD
jgi:hypothetical protein